MSLSRESCSDGIFLVSCIEGDAEEGLTSELDGKADISDVEGSLLGIGFTGGITDMEGNSCACALTRMMWKQPEWILMLYAGVDMQTHCNKGASNDPTGFRNGSTSSFMRTASRGSLVVKASDRGWFVMSLSPVPLKTAL
ncbi:hypothetical protein TNCV_2282251 [Trichonephila clavipes]|nr:hypothetical protein TNCV_2282251 [Trichonephila clavipes]